MLVDFAQSIKINDYLIEDLVVTHKLGQLTETTECYDKEKAVVIKFFFEILKKNKSLGFFAQSIQDPQDQHLQTTFF